MYTTAPTAARWARPLAGAVERHTRLVTIPNGPGGTVRPAPRRPSYNLDPAFVGVAPNLRDNQDYLYQLPRAEFGQ